MHACARCCQLFAEALADREETQQNRSPSTCRGRVHFPQLVCQNFSSELACTRRQGQTVLCNTVLEALCTHDMPTYPFICVHALVRPCAHLHAAPPVRLLPAVLLHELHAPASQPDDAWQHDLPAGPGPVSTDVYIPTHIECDTQSLCCYCQWGHQHMHQMQDVVIHTLTQRAHSIRLADCVQLRQLAMTKSATIASRTPALYPVSPRDFMLDSPAQLRPSLDCLASAGWKAMDHTDGGHNLGMPLAVLPLSGEVSVMFVRVRTNGSFEGVAPSDCCTVTPWLPAPHAAAGSHARRTRHQNACGLLSAGPRPYRCAPSGPAVHNVSRLNRCPLERRAADMSA